MSEGPVANANRSVRCAYGMSIPGGSVEIAGDEYVPITLYLRGEVCLAPTGDNAT